MNYFQLPSGLAWCKSNLKLIHQNKDLKEIMDFGDLWRSRGHIPLLHVISPAMGYDFNTHEDASGIVDNIPSHIDLLIVDFNNLDEPQLIDNWLSNAGKNWKLWEFESGEVKYNGTYQDFVKEFNLDPNDFTPADPPISTTSIPTRWDISLLGGAVKGTIEAVIKKG